MIALIESARELRLATVHEGNIVSVFSFSGPDEMVSSLTEMTRDLGMLREPGQPGHC